MKRGQLTRGQPIRRTRMRQGPSKKQAAKDAEWTKTRRQWLVMEPRCKVRLTAPGDCLGRMEVHHVLLRSQGGKNDGSTPLMTLCAGHHEFVHLNKLKAMELGARI